VNCEESRHLLLDYLGNELEHSSAAELRRHLNICSSCRQEFAALSKVQATMAAGWPDEEIPQNLVFRQEQVTLPRVGWWKRVAFTSKEITVLGMAATVMICLSLWILSQARMEFAKDSVQISFGTVKEPAHDRPSSFASDEAAKKELQNQIEQAMFKLHQEQTAQLQQSLLKLRADVEANRKMDMSQIARGLKYLEETQSVVWKEAVQNSSNLDTLARDLYVRTSSVRQ